MYTIKSYDTKVNTAFERISTGNLLDAELRPYTRQFIGEIIQYFQEREEYEKCQILKDALNDLDHDNNYNRWKTQSRQMI